MCKIPCFHGDCIGVPNYNQTCLCDFGWSEAACDVPLCGIPSGKGCLHGGACIAPNICHCALGWTGINCNEVELIEPAPPFLILSFITISFAAWSLGRWVSKKIPQIPIPKITIYLFVGILCGPYICQMITLTAIRELGFVSRACLGFLTAMAGSELNVPLLRETGRSVIYIVSTVVIGCFCIVLVLIYSINPIIGWMHTSSVLSSNISYYSMNNLQILLISMMFASIALAVAPTANIAIIYGMKATGRWCSLTISVTVMIEILSLIFFSLTEAITKNAFGTQSGSIVNDTLYYNPNMTHTDNPEQIGQVITQFIMKFFVSIILGACLSYVILILSWPFSFWISQNGLEDYDEDINEKLGENKDKEPKTKKNEVECDIVQNEIENENEHRPRTFYKLAFLDCLFLFRGIKTWFYKSQPLKILRHIYRTLLILFLSWIIFNLSDSITLHDWIEPLLLLASMGFVMSNFTYYGDSFKRLLYGVAPLVFACFFILIGSSMNIELMFSGSAVLIALIIFTVRFIAMYVSSFFACKITRQNDEITHWFYTSLIIQAGLALGLSSHVALVFPTFGYSFNTIVACLVIFTQLIGPVLLRIAVRAVGEDNQIGKFSPEIIEKIHNTLQIQISKKSESKIDVSDLPLNAPLLPREGEGDIHIVDNDTDTYDPISWLRPNATFRGTLRQIQSNINNSDNSEQKIIINNNNINTSNRVKINQSRRLQQIYNNLRSKRRHRQMSKTKKDDNMEKDDFGTL